MVNNVGSTQETEVGVVIPQIHHLKQARNFGSCDHLANEPVDADGQVICSGRCCADCVTPPAPPQKQLLQHASTVGQRIVLLFDRSLWKLDFSAVQAAAEAVTSPSGYSHQCQLQGSSNRRRPLRTHRHTHAHTDGNKQPHVPTTSWN